MSCVAVAVSRVAAAKALWNELLNLPANQLRAATSEQGFSFLIGQTYRSRTIDLKNRVRGRFHEFTVLSGVRRQI